MLDIWPSLTFEGWGEGVGVGGLKVLFEGSKIKIGIVGIDIGKEFKWQRFRFCF